MDLEIALEGFFFEKVNGSAGQTSLFQSRRHQAETTPLQKAHGVFCQAWRLLPSKRHTASKSLIPSTGIFTSNYQKAALDSISHGTWLLTLHCPDYD